MSIARLTKEEYEKQEGWRKFFEDDKHIKNMPYNLSWIILMTKLTSDNRINKINEKLKERIKKDKLLKIYPRPQYIFEALNVTSAKNLKVVFIGQDPYHGPSQAMGLSFSVPHNIPIPSSLDNIYNNMIKYKHIKKKPTSGNLWFWAAQGCLMLNAGLTVEEGSPNSHTKLWEWLTDAIIQYISDFMNDIIFVMWGGNAYKKISLIDLDKHHTIISSHPSGLSAYKEFQNYPAFMNEDHFGKINILLTKLNKSNILWN